VERSIQLQRTLGLFEITLSGIGTIVGAGIYALIGEAAGLAGNAVWISFALSAVAAIFTGLSYAELAAMFPRASAEYEYASQAFGRLPAFIIGWLIILSGVIGAAIVSLGFAGYFGALTGASPLPSALLLLASLSAVISASIKQSARMAMALTSIGVLGLVFIILLGAPDLSRTNLLEMSPLGFSGIFQASALIFFAFLGFEEIVKLTEEAKDPEKNIPRGLILAISASIVLYIMVALSAVSILGWERLSQSSAPFADIARSALGPSASLISRLWRSLPLQIRHCSNCLLHPGSSLAWAVPGACLGSWLAFIPGRALLWRLPFFAWPWPWLLYSWRISPL